MSSFLTGVRLIVLVKQSGRCTESEEVSGMRSASVTERRYAFETETQTACSQVRFLEDKIQAWFIRGLIGITRKKAIKSNNLVPTSLTTFL